jgi:hypothetical protein
LADGVDEKFVDLRRELQAGAGGVVADFEGL